MKHALAAGSMRGSVATAAGSATYRESVRALVVLVDAAVVFVAAYVVYIGVTAVRRGRRPEPSMEGWQLLHYAQDGHTVVAVARETAEGHVIEKHVVARIPDSDEDWSRKFVEAKLDAEERAFHLNADGSPSGRPGG